MPDEEDLLAAHLQTINNKRSQCFFSTERSHSNIADFLGKILPTEMSVKVPLRIATADGKQARLAVAASQFPLKKDGVDETSYHRDVVNGMRSMLHDLGDCGEECPSQILLSTIDAHCETVALALAEHVVEVLADSTRKTVSRSCLDTIHREFVLKLGGLNTTQQVSALMKHEVNRLYDAHVHGIGWNSSFHQEVMWASHCDLLKQAGMPLSEFDLGCGLEFQKSFLLGTPKFSSILSKCAQYAIENTKLIVLPCYVLMYVFHCEELETIHLNKNPLDHSACYSCHCFALLLDGKRKSMYVIDGNGSIIPGIFFAFASGFCPPHIHLTM